ncbi:MAG: MAPEG family protein, partial [Porticoccaceae bacterium]|nr:MAPEG family protein [Porticoccaceae bacterium]
MTPELTALALAALLQSAQFILFAIPANLELGIGYTSSARDRPPSRQLSEKTARLQRALNNHFEGLILFTIAVLVVTLSNQSTPFTAICAYAYLAARL